MYASPPLEQAEWLAANKQNTAPICEHSKHATQNATAWNHWRTYIQLNAPQRHIGCPHQAVTACGNTRADCSRYSGAINSQMSRGISTGVKTAWKQRANWQTFFFLRSRPWPAREPQPSACGNPHKHMLPMIVRTNAQQLSSCLAWKHRLMAAGAIAVQAGVC